MTRMKELLCLRIDLDRLSITPATDVPVSPRHPRAGDTDVLERFCNLPLTTL